MAYEVVIKDRRAIEKLDETEITFVSFGAPTAKWWFARKRLVAQFSKSQWNVNFVFLTWQDISMQFPSVVQDFIFGNPKGFGLWVWKPKVIAHALALFPKSSIIVYLDAGCDVNLSIQSESVLNYIIEQTMDSGVSVFELLELETDFTRSEVIQHYFSHGLPSSSRQILATTFWLRSDFVDEFCDLWFNVMIQNDFFFLKETISHSPSRGTLNHRHDQSLLSLIVKKFYDIEPLPLSFVQTSSPQDLSLPIAITRNRTSVPYFSQTKKAILHQLFEKALLRIFNRFI